MFPYVWALWASAVVIGVGMAFMYPSLMALTVNRVADGERPAAISSFTMFFEIGTVAGGLALGTVAELTSKRAAFAACVLDLRRRAVAAPRPCGAGCRSARRALRTGADLRSRRRRLSVVELEVELSTAAPFAARHLASFLAARAVPGVEAWDGEMFHRPLRLPHGHGVARLRICRRDRPVRARLEAGGRSRSTRRPLPVLRRLLDLDASSAVIDTALRADPTLAPLIVITPGLRLAGSVEPFETAIRAVIGQQISVAGARTVAGRIVASAGEPIRIPGGPVTHLFPSPAALAAIDPALLPMPASRRRTIVELAAQVADGRIDLRPDADRDAAAAALLAVPGIGPWTVGYVRMRGLGDPDVFLPTDLGVKIGLRRLGIDAGHAERWRPWRSYALHHVWIAAGLPE